MEFQSVIETRRSVRQYDPAFKLSEDAVRELLSAAILAPSWKNSQTARCYCILSEDKMAEFREKCLPPFNAKNCENAAALIVTTFVRDRSGFERDGAASNEVGNGWGYYDLGLHNENLVLKAKDMGLDSLIMGIRDEAAIRRMLSVGEEETIVAVISLGRAAQPAAMPRRKTPDDIAKFF